MAARERLSAYWFGRFAEYVAIVYLISRGYQVLGHRHRTPFGEIDIACLKSDTLVIVEVKARKDLDTAAFALSPRQQDRLRNAANFLVSGHKRYANRAIRFDCCMVTWYMRVRHITNAFM